MRRPEATFRAVAHKPNEPAMSNRRRRKHQGLQGGAIVRRTESLHGPAENREVTYGLDYSSLVAKCVAIGGQGVGHRRCR